MIEFVFTIDYEIYGNGEGSLRELVYEPAERLGAIFRKWGKKFVLFVEAAELEMMETEGTDEVIHSVKRQILDFHREGFEIGLHLHPQWYNAKFSRGKWMLDYDEYNLCTLSNERIVQIVNRSIDYLRVLLEEADYEPFSFRAGNWLFQPTRNLAEVLVERGIKVDSSVFKGGLQHLHKLDYRPAQKNGYYWQFTEDVIVPDSQGTMIELPIYTKMVPIWQMPTSKRLSLQQKSSTQSQSSKNRLFRLLDILRFRYPLKLDFCRMTIEELKCMIDTELKIDKMKPEIFRPIVAIGHTKDLIDFETVELLMSYLQEKDISLSTLRDISKRCTG